MVENYSSFGNSFQENLVQVIFYNKSFADQISEVLEIEFFELEYLQKFLKLLLDYREKYGKHPSLDIMQAVIETDKSLDNSLLGEQVRDFFKQKIKQRGLIEDEDFIKDVALDFAKKQDLRKAMVDAIGLLKTSSFLEISKVINTSLAKGLDNNIGHDYIKDFEERYKLTIRNPISTGWTEIDKLIQGGLGAGELACAIASTGAGKSFTLVHIGAQALLAGKNVLYYTLELSDSVIGKRFDSCITKVELDKLSSLKEEILQDIEKVPGKLLIKKYPMNAVTTQIIDSHVEKCVKRGFVPDLILVDYADKIRPMPSVYGRNKEKRHDLESIYEELRNMAERYKVPIYTVSQCNRSGASAELVTLEAIGEAYNKAFPCDFIFTITRTAVERQENTARFFIAKNRFGEDSMTFPVKFDLSCVKIDVLSSDANSITSAATMLRAKSEKYSKDQMKKLYQQYKTKKQE